MLSCWNLGFGPLRLESYFWPTEVEGKNWAVVAHKLFVICYCNNRKLIQYSLLIFNWDIYPLVVELQKFFMYSRYKSFIRYVNCKYFFPICGFFSHFLFCPLKYKSFKVWLSPVYLFSPFCHLCFWYHILVVIQYPRSLRFVPVFSSKKLCLHI